MKKKRENELVSVVISNYNNEKYIKECLDSIKKQTYENIEIIIIDDSSTDDSVNIINQWINKEGAKFKEKERITFITLPKNVGFSGALTLGFYLSSGEFIAIQDGDDISLENRIEKQVEFLKNNIDIGAVGSDYIAFDSESKNIIFQKLIAYGVANIKKIFANGKNAVSSGTILFKGEIFDSIGGLSRRLDGAEDYEFITKLLPYGVDNINEVLYKYRLHENQRSIEFYDKKRKNKDNTKKGNIKVLIAVDKFNIGGTETHILYLAKKLIENEIDVVILAGEGKLSSEFKKLDCRTYSLDFPAVVLTDINRINIFEDKIRQIIEAEDINIVHVHQSSSGSLCTSVANQKQIPVVFTVHGMYYHDIIPHVFNRCDKIISVSYPVYNWLLKFGIQSSVIANGIDYESFSKKYETQGLKDLYGINDSESVLLYCSRIAWGKVKICENIIRVCRDLNLRENLNIHALIVGDGQDYDRLKYQAEKANQKMGKEYIHFVGASANVEKYYSMCDFVIGTGRVAIEAMAAKKRVIATGNNGYFGIVNKENFDIGWNTYFGDHGSVAANDAIYLYDDIKKILSKENYIDEEVDEIFEKSKEIFNINTITEQIIATYMNALS